MTQTADDLANAMILTERDLEEIEVRSRAADVPIIPAALMRRMVSEIRMLQAVYGVCDEERRELQIANDGMARELDIKQKENFVLKQTIKNVKDELFTLAYEIHYQSAQED